MAGNESDTSWLMNGVRNGDATSLGRLLARYQRRIRALIATRMDRRLAARFDPSDVVQATLAAAARRLPDYLRDRPLPFYPWLRRLALERLIDFQRQHLHAEGRSVRREAQRTPQEDVKITGGLVGGSSPGDRIERVELQDQVAAALARLPESDREVLVLRHFKGMATVDVARALGLTEAAVKSRHFRALDRLRALLPHEVLKEKS